MPRPKLKTWLSLAISLACLAYVLRELDFGRLWELARQVNPLYVAWINVLFALCMAVRTRRWQVLMRPVVKAPFAPLFSANLIGFMANNILPARVGELVRGWAGSRLAGLPVSAALGTIVVERLLDVTVLLGFLLVMLLFLDPGGRAEGIGVEYLHAAGWSLLTGYLIALAVMAALVAWPRAAISLGVKLAAKGSARLGERVESLLVSFTQGLATLGQGRALLHLLGLSVLVRVPILGMHYFFLPAVGLPQSLFLAAMATLGHLTALTIPAGPGYLGTYQLGVFWALLLAGAPREPALAYTVIFWAAQYFPIVLAGLVETWRHGLALSSLSRQGRELARRGPDA
ncbi:MAG: flippase-like domain-containing protein [Desulfarculus sp.]|nr:flippase-like domain-containing protein [Desulfarculus sp.]